jgi:aminomethyltransferase
MARPSPFHARTSAACDSWSWKEWSGFAAVRTYVAHSEQEYFGVRHAAGMIDVSPLYKYDLRGPHAAALLAYVFSRDIGKLGAGRITYGCLLDERGKVLDDGTVSRLGPEWFRLTSSEPWHAWLAEQAAGRDVAIDDVTDSVAALAVQGPASRAILASRWPSVAKLGFFRAIDVDGAIVGRTGYTGDLGYEIWVAASDALPTWDALVAAGAPFDLRPFGLDALDVLRIEAGFVLQGVDYVSARATLLERRRSTPDEVGLGWTVDLERGPFLGQSAIRAERRRGPAWALVGLELSWPGIEALYASADLPPHLAPVASREPVPVYDARGRAQVGYVTSRTWSPITKRFLALATVRAEHARLGTTLRVEFTPEFERRQVEATVVDKPFYDPPHKRGSA